MGLVTLGPALVVVLLVLVVAAAMAHRIGGFDSGWDVVVAAVRAVIQLATVSALIVLVLRSWWFTAVFLMAMVAVGAGTSARRITGRTVGAGWWAVVPIAAGALPVLGLIAASRVLPLHPVAVLPAAGILIGGAMTATSLSGRRIAEELTNRWPEHEAALSLGVSRRAATRWVARPAAGSALLPNLDQTRTVGVVSLPGAFVGTLLAGASPWQAGATQVLVLAGLLLVQVIAVSTTLDMISRGRLPAGRSRLPA